MSTIPEILRSNAASWPRRDALVATRLGQDIAVTFSQLENQANLFADMLYSRGIQPGDPVLVFVPMSIELYVALLGIFRLGAGAVFLDPSAGLGHIDACCSRLPPRALVSVRPLRLLRPFVTGLRKIPHVFAPPRDLHGSLGNLPPPPGPDDAALITFTSGSTGQPKAAARTHRFLIAQHAALRGSIKLEEGERDLTTLPVFVLANLASGITSILPDARISRPGSVNARRIARQVARLRPARTGGSPAFYQRLLSEPACLAGFRKIYTGGAPVFPAPSMGRPRRSRSVMCPAGISQRRTGRPCARGGACLRACQFRRFASALSRTSGGILRLILRRSLPAVLERLSWLATMS
ncbi:MAG: AMP-binding protein [Alphaproteobacteria bacterium]|nr:AMP-binding protein [Alphaproteobacteria bacterium]